MAEFKLSDMLLWILLKVEISTVYTVQLSGSSGS
jgi:hypothetical protein